MEPQTIPCDQLRPFIVREDLLWHFDALVVAKETHHYDGEVKFATFMRRCGYLSYTDLLDAGQEETLSFVQAHTYFNLCVFASQLFDKTFDIKCLLQVQMPDDEGTNTAVAPTSLAIEFIVDIYEHIKRGISIKGGEEYGILKKAERLMDALESCVGTLQWFSEVLQFYATGDEPRWSLDLCKDASTIYLSCLILGEHFEGLYKALQTDSITLRAPREWSDASYVFHNTLTLNGWCPREIQILRLQRWPATLIAYLCRMRNPRTARKHKNCTIGYCLHETVDDKSYRTQHIPECVGCEDIDIDHPTKMMSRCFEDGCNPIISFEFQSNPDGSLRILKKVDYLYTNINDLEGTAEVISSTTTSEGCSLPIPKVEQTQYVAISHVWSDGLGNPTRNSLPTCQIMRLQKLVDQLEIEGDKPTPFWIDTLCVPLNPLYRKRAIQDMHLIYAAAAQVLVLDATLSDLPASHWNSHPEALLVSVLVCPWTRRLWTYQEAQSAAYVSFQFKGAAFFLQHLLQRVAATHVSSQPGALLPSIGEIEKEKAYKLDVILASGLKYLYSYLNDAAEPLSARFLQCAQALQARRTSKIGDEAICLSNLLGKSPSTLHDVPDHLRMKSLIRSCQDLPSSIVFYRGPRYDNYGDRWIPRSFLMGIANGERLETFPSGRVRHTDEGVRAIYNGVRFKLCDEFLKIMPDGKQVIPIIFPGQERPYMIEDPDSTFSWDMLINAELALVFHDLIESPNTHGYNQRVILVSIQREKEDWLYVRFERNTRVYIDIDASELPELPYITADPMQLQKWCIG